MQFLSVNSSWLNNYLQLILIFFFNCLCLLKRWRGYYVTFSDSSSWICIEGHYDNHRTNGRGQDEKDRYSSTFLPRNNNNNNRSWREDNTAPKVNENRFNRNVQVRVDHEISWSSWKIFS